MTALSRAKAHLLLLLPVCFLTTTAHARIERLTVADYALAAVSFTATLWFVVNYERYANWVTGFSSLSSGGVIAGTTLFVLCLELCRRAVGFGLTVVLLALLAYVAFGQHIPGSFRHAGISYTYFLEMQTIGTDGQLSGGLMAPSLLLAGVVLILLGTGMPTTATYIMGMMLLAPVFTGKFGLPVMEVHMFMLFYASLSAISPPVAVAAFAAAAIAKANPFKLMPYACKLAVGGFVLPFFFVFNPGILMQGGVLRILSDTLVATVLVVTSALVLHGLVRQRPIPLPLRNRERITAATELSDPNAAGADRR